MLPNFLVIGAMKAGTDSLWEYLRNHPQVFMSQTKELDFFAAELNWSRGQGWYGQQFAGADGAIAVGEASTSYAKFPVHQGVPSRIAQVVPGALLIYLVRQPVERIRSQYLHQVLLGEEREPIARAVLANPVYVNFSRYAMQVEQYLDQFPRDRILIVRSESLRDDREATMARVFDFLGVGGRPPEEVLDREFHRTAEKRVLRSFLQVARRVPGYGALSRHVPGVVKRRTHRFRTRGVDPERAVLPDRIRLELEGLLRDDVQRLRRYIGDDFDGWGIG
jgi:hypothetical protein